MEFGLKLTCENDEELSRLWKEFCEAKENLERHLDGIRLQVEIKK